MLAKGSAEFDGNQKDKERHSIVVTVNMPSLQLMDLIAAYNGNTGRTASVGQQTAALFGVLGVLALGAAVAARAAKRL